METLALILLLNEQEQPFCSVLNNVKINCSSPTWIRLNRTERKRERIRTIITQLYLYLNMASKLDIDLYLEVFPPKGHFVLLDISGPVFRNNICRLWCLTGKIIEVIVGNPFRHFRRWSKCLHEGIANYSKLWCSEKKNSHWWRAWQHRFHWVRRLWEKLCRQTVMHKCSAISWIIEDWWFRLLSLAVSKP